MGKSLPTGGYVLERVAWVEIGGGSATYFGCGTGIEVMEMPTWSSLRERMDVAETRGSLNPDVSITIRCYSTISIKNRSLFGTPPAIALSPPTYIIHPQTQIYLERLKTHPFHRSILSIGCTFVEHLRLEHVIVFRDGTLGTR